MFMSDKMSNLYIGGYFELELSKGKSLHPSAMALNSARHCYEYILRARKYQRVYVPYYTCEVLIHSMTKLGVRPIFYAINKNLEPLNYPILEENEAFLYTNYYGLKQDIVQNVCYRYGKNAIIDNAQAFYAKPVSGIDSFFSPRKFFGVPDGGYLYTDSHVDIDIEQDTSYNRMSHLLMRIDCGPEEGYESFRYNSHTLIDAPILRMSRLTSRILSSIDYEWARERRKENFMYLHENLKGVNSFSFAEDELAVPMVYPYWSNDSSLRQKLIKNKVFVAKYWPSIAERERCPRFEIDLVEHLIPLPVDQRYSQTDMERIMSLITE